MKQVNWLRVLATVLSSKLFFIASCTGGAIVGSIAYEGMESGNRAGVERPPDPRLAIIATVPDAARPGARKVVQTSLGELGKFRQENPDYSFLLPPGQGQLEGPGVLMRTEYSIAADGPQVVLVETRFHDDEHHVLGKYAATEKDIKPLYTKFTHDLANFMVGVVFGVPLALLLAIIGAILSWYLKRREGSPSGTDVKQ